MEKFILNNYIILIIVLLFLLFALIGYLIDTSRNKKRNKSNEEESAFYTEENSLDDAYIQEDILLPEVSINDEGEEEIINDYNDDEFIVSDKVLDKVPEVEAPNISEK